MLIISAEVEWKGDHTLSLAGISHDTLLNCPSWSFLNEQTISDKLLINEDNFCREQTSLHIPETFNGQPDYYSLGGKSISVPIFFPKFEHYL